MSSFACRTKKLVVLTYINSITYIEGTSDALKVINVCHFQIMLWKYLCYSKYSIEIKKNRERKNKGKSYLSCFQTIRVLHMCCHILSELRHNFPILISNQDAKPVQKLYGHVRRCWIDFPKTNSNISITTKLSCFDQKSSLVFYIINKVLIIYLLNL